MKQTILIGPMNKKDVGSIPILNRAFAIGLREEYDFIPFNVNRKYGKSSVSNFNIINLGYFVLHYLTLIFKLIKDRPDVFHYAITSNWNFEKSVFFLKTAKFFGVKKVIGHLHGGSFDIFINKLEGSRKKRAIKWMNSLDAIIVASNYWKSFLISKEVDTIVEVVNNPIDTNYVKEIKNKKDVKRQNRFLFVGALGERKGFYDIIEAATDINEDFVLDAVGSEDRQNDMVKINDLIEKNRLSSKINIIVSEKMKIQEKVDFFTKNAIFLFPSHNENFPLVIIEAACAGMAIISTKVGAIPEFFTHMKNIYFITPGDVNEMREAIDFITKNTDERIRLGNEARKVYETKLSEGIVMNQLDSVYKTILN